MYLLLFICWIIFNGNCTLEIVLTGLAMSALVYAFMWKFLGWNVKRDILMGRFIIFGLKYIGILIIEIIKATLATIGITFNEKVEIQPVIAEFDVNIKAEVFRVILANSITMTPGTITVSLSGKHFKVHALDESFALGLDDSVFVKQLMKADRMLEVFNNSRKKTDNAGSHAGEKSAKNINMADTGITKEADR